MTVVDAGLCQHRSGARPLLRVAKLMARVIYLRIFAASTRLSTKRKDFVVRHFQTGNNLPHHHQYAPSIPQCVPRIPVYLSHASRLPECSARLQPKKREQTTLFCYIFLLFSETFLHSDPKPTPLHGPSLMRTTASTINDYLFISRLCEAPSHGPVHKCTRGGEQELVYSSWAPIKV
jgi:hypothetical protein